MQGLAAWPKHSAPPEFYRWEAFGKDDLIPTANPYSVGSDLHDLELGWIFDVERKRKLRVQPIAKVIGLLSAQSGSASLYIL